MSTDVAICTAERHGYGTHCALPDGHTGPHRAMRSSMVGSFPAAWNGDDRAKAKVISNKTDVLRPVAPTGNEGIA